MNDKFEEIRDEIELKIKQAIRNWRLRYRLSDSSVFTCKDLGIKALNVVQQQGRDNGITGFEIQKAINKVGWSVENQTNWKENLALRWIEKFASRGYYGYAKLMKMLDMPIESPTIRWWNARYLNSLLSFINPGGKAFIKASTYIINVAVSLCDNLTVEGEGSNTLLQTTSDISILYANDKENIIIQNLRVEGDGDISKTSQRGINFGWAKESSIIDCFINNLGYDGIIVGFNSENILIEGNDITNCKDDGISLSNVAGDIRVIGNTSRSNTYSGIHVDTGCDYLLIDSNFCEENDDCGIEAVRTSGDGSTKSVISNNITKSNTNAGINLTGVSSYKHENWGVSNNLTSNNAIGIKLEETQNILIIGNYVVDNTPSHGINLNSNNNNISIVDNYVRGSTSHGICLNVNNDDCVIQGNVCVNNTEYGLRIVNANNEDNIVKNNYLLGNTSGAVNGVGTNTIFSQNVGYVTENSGTATIPNGTATTGNVAHGLAGTPTIVMTTGRDADTEEVRCSSRDATNIVLSVTGNVGGDRTIDWYAEYKP